MDYLEYKELYHHGVKGMKWGVRHEHKDDTVSEKPRFKFGETHVGKTVSKIGNNFKRAGNKTNEKMAKLDYKVEKNFLKRSNQKELLKDMDSVSKSSRAKRGYVMVGSLLAVVGTAAIAKKVKNSAQAKKGATAVAAFLPGPAWTK